MNLLGREISEIFLFVGLLAIMLLSLVLHWMYLRMIESKVKRTSDSEFEFEDLLGSLHISQGSNFNTVMIASWCLFCVALVFLYFLTPSIFPHWNYFKVPRIASWSWGFATLGIAVLIPSALISAFVPRAYSYYQIHRSVKRTSIAIPVFLIVSILCSFDLGTIYPSVDRVFWDLGYLMLLISLILMVAPVFIGFLEEWRS